MMAELEEDQEQAATAGITGGLKQEIGTRGYVFNFILQEKAIADRLRHFPTWVSSRNLANETSDAAVQALVEAVTGRYDTCIRYYRVKRKLMGVGDLHEWDRYAPVAGASPEMNWDEAQELGLGSFHRVSPQVAGLVKPCLPDG